MNCEIVTLSKMLVTGLKIRTTNENNKAVADIGALWGKLIQENLFQQIQHKTDNMAIGLYTEYEGDATKPYSFLCGCQVSDTTDGFETITIPAGKYAKFTVVGNMVDAVGKAWGDIWNMDLDRAYTCDFEHYHNDSADMANQTIDIYIALK